MYTSYGTVHRDIEAATDPNGSVKEKLPKKIKGKDGKERPAKISKEKFKTTLKSNHPNEEGKTAKEERPKIAELLEIVFRGLQAAEEANALALKKNAVFFLVNGFQVKVFCKVEK